MSTSQSLLIVIHDAQTERDFIYLALLNAKSDRRAN